MTGKFSAALKLGDLNDFIAPSQSCVVSLNGLKKQEQPPNEEPQQDGLVKLQTRADFNTIEAKPVKVTLHDCLACSGCITSAETVMLEQQSVDEFMNQLSSGNKTMIVSVSPQSRASLATYYGITPLQAFKKLTTFLKNLGVKAVFDTSCSRDLSLIESCEEFLRRYTAHRDSHNSDAKNKDLPMLASSCPGWVCYAEKTLDSYILPHISSVKSPQQAMGAIIKRHACYNLGVDPEKIYHVTVMPCYDKKLEASRDDFIFAVDDDKFQTENGGKTLTEVDCVLTSGEVLDLLQAKCSDFMALEEGPLDRLLTNVDEAGHLYGARGGSGGYAECIFRHAAYALYGKKLSSPLSFKTLRNSDFKEIMLEVEGEVVLRFACCYGFRNIQNIVRKVKAGKCEYQFVEVMACPSGCLNGGGQIKPRKGQTAKELIQNLESSYLEEVNVCDPFDNPIIKELYDSWLGHPGSEKSLKFMHTGYHAREKSITSQLSNW